MLELNWKEPPPEVSSRYAPVLALLKQHPGRWALVVEKRKSSGAAAPWKKLGCEARAVRTDDAEPAYDVYARWPQLADRPTPASGPASKAVATGTALVPPSRHEPATEGANGYTKFLASQGRK